MSDKLDLSGLIADMSNEDAVAFVTSHLNPRTKAEFLAKRKNQGLQEQYEADISKIGNLPQNVKIKRISQIKAKYRDAGLEVW